MSANFIRWKPLCCAAVFLIGTGCTSANVTFKPGASPEQITDAEAECRRANDSEDGFAECMKERGYWTGKIEDPNPSQEPRGESAPDR